MATPKQVNRKTMGLKGGVSSPGVEGLNYGGGVVNLNDEIQLSNFKFVPQIFGGAIWIPMRKIAPPNIWGGYLDPYEQNSPKNGNWTQDAAGIAVAD